MCLFMEIDKNLVSYCVFNCDACSIFNNWNDKRKREKWFIGFYEVEKTGKTTKKGKKNGKRTFDFGRSNGWTE